MDISKTKKWARDSIAGKVPTSYTAWSFEHCQKKKKSHPKDKQTKKKNTGTTEHQPDPAIPLEIYPRAQNY